MELSLRLGAYLSVIVLLSALVNVYSPFDSALFWSLSVMPLVLAIELYGRKEDSWRLVAAIGVPFLISFLVARHYVIQYTHLDLKGTVVIYWASILVVVGASHLLERRRSGATADRTSD